MSAPPVAVPRTHRAGGDEAPLAARPAPAWPMAALLRPHAGTLLTGAAAGALSALAGAGLLATSTWLLQRAAEQPPVLALMVAIVSVRALALVRAVARWGERTATHATGLAVVRDLRAAVVADLVPRVPEGLRARAGTVLEAVVRDLAAVEQALVAAVVPVLAATLTGLGAVAVTALIEPRAAAVLAVGLLVGGGVVPWAARTVTAPLRDRLADARRGLAAVTVELLEQAPEAAVAGTTAKGLDDVAVLEADVDRLEASLARRRAATVVAATVTVAVTVAGVGLCVAAGVPDGTLAPVSVGAVVMLALGAFDPGVDLPPALERLDEAVAARARIETVARAPVPVAEPVNPASAGAGAAPEPVTIHAAGLSVRRPGDAHDTLRDVDLALAAGGRLAVVGPSGAGKSTLASTLVRFLSPWAGRLEIGGRDVRELPGDTVRRTVGLAGQDAHLFPIDLAANLRLAAADASDDELWAALEAVDLASWARSLPEGLHSAVGRDGGALSGGQRRRMAVAQLLLAGRDVLVLDEPTAELDPVTGRAVVDRVLTAAGARPVLVITHDPGIAALTHATVTLPGR